MSGGGVYRVRPGEQVTVALDAAIGSGHRWQLRSSATVDAPDPGDYFGTRRPAAPLVRLVSQGQIPPMLINEIDAKQTFTLEGVAAGQAVLEFEYLGPGDDVLRTATVDVEVGGLDEPVLGA